MPCDLTDLQHRSGIARIRPRQIFVLRAEAVSIHVQIRVIRVVVAHAVGFLPCIWNTIAVLIDPEIGTYNPTRAETYPGIRPKGIVEKCTFCDHRLAHGEMPACVEACPTDARIFGDRNDPESDVAKLLTKHAPKVLQPEKGTQPNVLYIKEYK